MHLWRSPQQRFPNDHAWLARKFGRSVQAFENDILPLMREFMQADGNWWTQKRLSAEWEYVRKTTSRQSEAAKARWAKHKSASHGNAERHESGNAPTPTPTPTIKNTPSKPPKGAGVLNGHLEDFEIWYSAYPRKIARGAAERAFAKAIKIAKLDDLIAGAKRYAATVADSEPRFVAHPATWLNAKRWLDEQPAAAKSTAAAGVAVEPWEQRVKGFRKTGFWNPAWGFKPGQQGCSVPPQFLTEQERAAR